MARKFKEIVEIKAEIAALKAVKPRIPPSSSFGDDNIAQIDAQLDVLENRMSEDDIYGTFDPENNPDSSQHALDGALDALRWMEGEEGESPSSGWAAITK